jgi:hypothetical protein
MSTDAEPTVIGLSERAHNKLKRLKEDEHFLEMVDAYRCGISLALAHGVVPDELQAPRTNVFSIATVDPNREIAAAIAAVMDVGDIPVYRMAERLAEWGVNELSRRAEAGDIDFGALLDEVDGLQAS